MGTTVRSITTDDHYPNYDLIAVMILRRNYIKDGKKQISTPSNIYFYAMHENLCAFPLECVQCRMVSFRVENIKLHWDAFKSMFNTHNVYLQCLGINIPNVSE